MEANELRIGNYAYQNIDNIPDHYVVFQVGEIHPNSKFIENALPIPLTEDWLLRFPKWFADLIQHKFYNYSNGTDTVHVDIEHVHTAQNLYFALTNEELILKTMCIICSNSELGTEKNQNNANR